ncbi:MAG: hypothetical protein JKY56_27560 [Kofleriaceae bacterium]|nr:hypothetical protein [Kofleriaceae bacterium]
MRREPRESDTASSGTGWKIAFIGGVLVTSGMAAGFAYNGFKVIGELKDDKESAFATLESTAGAINLPEFQRLAADVGGDGSCGKARNAGSTGDAVVNAALADLVRACDEGEDAATMTNIFIAGTAVAALATVYFGYKGWVLNDGDKEKMTGRQTKKNRVVVTPQLTPRSVGAGLSIDF